MNHGACSTIFCETMTLDCDRVPRCLPVTPCWDMRTLSLKTHLPSRTGSPRAERLSSWAQPGVMEAERLALKRHGSHRQDRENRWLGLPSLSVFSSPHPAGFAPSVKPWTRRFFKPVYMDWYFIYCFRLQEPQEEPNSLVPSLGTTSRGCEPPSLLLKPRFSTTSA